MRTIKIRGRIFEQCVEDKDCLFCKYETGCDAWGCVSPGCELTGECFGGKMNGATWCPFLEIPKDKQFLVEIIKS